MRRRHRSNSRLSGAGTAGAVLALVLAASWLGAGPALAQGWQWPWQQQEGPRPPPVPAEPVYRPEPQMAPPPGEQPGPAGWGNRGTPICLQLEQRLVQESGRGDQSRNLIPMVDSEIRQVEQQLRGAQIQLDRSNCYDVFLFSKTLKRNQKCLGLASQVDGARRRLADLDTQRQQLMASVGRSYQDDIIRELARNKCGANYEQQARGFGGGPSSSTWSEEDSGGPGGLGSFNALPYATYRTVCVRLCDGYYFPVSFSTLPNHFERDAESCQSKCAAPAELFYYQNPGGAAEQMLGYRSNAPYTELKTAFRYRKEFVAGCSCKQAEFLPEGGAPQQSGQLPPGQAPAAQPGSPPVSTASVPAGSAPREPTPPAGGELLPWAARRP